MFEPLPSRHLLDPELALRVDAVLPPPFSAETLPLLRAAIEAGLAMAPPAADDDVERVERILPGLPGSPDVRVLFYRPRGLTGTAPVILYLHGGGFVLGNADMGDLAARRWAEGVGCVLAAVDYRISPETRYPGALDDSMAALNWVAAHAAELNIDPARIAVRGDSAGGGLAAAVALKARDSGGPKLCFQLLNSPMLDDRTGITVPGSAYAGGFVWTPSDNRFAWEAYFGKPAGLDDTPIYAAPGRAAELSGLPPTFIGSATLDLFIDENLDYARRLIAAGVPTELYVAPGGYHGFEVLNPEARISRIFVAQGMAALRRAFETP